MSNLSKGMSEVIKKNLPAEVGEELKKVLEDYEKVKTHLANKIEDYKYLVERDQEKQTELSKHGNLAERERDVSQREAAVHKREVEQELILMKMERDCANNIAAAAQNFMINMSKNTVYKRTFQGEVPVGILPTHTDRNGYTQIGHAETATVKQTTTNEEE
jgi:hypothetical protein